MSEQQNNPPKKIIFPPTHLRPPAQSKDTIEPDIKTILNDGLSIISQEVLKYRHKVNNLQSLNADESRILVGYVKALVDIEKTMKKMESEEEGELSKASDDVLLAEAEELVANLKKKKKGNK